jgi:hypothetical protein
VAAFLGGVLYGKRLERWELARGASRITARSGMPIENRYIKDWPIPDRQEMPNP